MGKFTFLTVLALLLIGGCGGGDKPKFTEKEPEGIAFAQKTPLPECSGGFVLAVGDETITSDEVIAPVMEHLRPLAQKSSLQQFKEQARPQLEQILTTKVSNILLYSQAKRQAGEDIEEALEKAAESEVRKFIVRFEGDYAKAEQALKEMEMDWNSFKEYQKKMILSQSYIASQLPDNKPITYSELLGCYNDMKKEFFVRPAMLKLRLIDIQPARLDIADPNRSRLKQARELADELIGRLQAGEDFGKLANKYSHGHRRESGGLWKPLEPASLAKPYDILAAEAERLKPGQIAGPIETGEHIFIMKLEEKRAGSVEPFEKVQRQVEDKIRDDRWRQARKELVTKLAQQAALGNNDKFIDFCLRKIYRMSKQ